MIVIKAVIMAGGKGTRLRPLTCGLPKPMVPIINKPVMEHGINLLKRHEITDIAVTMAYLPENIEGYFETGKKWGVNLNYFIEDVPLGTAGSVRNTGDFLDETFIVISGDALTDLDLDAAIKFHQFNNSKATLVLRKEKVPLEYGVVITDDNGKVIRFLEKPSWGEVFSNTINTGIYILEPEVMEYYTKGENFDFSKDLFPRLLNDKIPMYGYVTDDYWCDIGALEPYKQTQFDLLSQKVNLPMGVKEIEKGVWIDEGTLVSNNAKLIPPVYIGKNCVINENSSIGPFTVIGNDCKIGPSASLKNTTLWNNCTFGSLSEARGTVICSKVTIGSKVKLYENSVIGEGSIIKDNSTIKQDIKIWPQKTVEKNATLTQNLIWGTSAKKNVFGVRNISGDLNTDITPEFATKLGAAFASIFKDEGALIISGDESKGTCLIKNALIAGVQSTGTRPIKVNNCLLPMSRFAIRYYNALGGIHVKKDPTSNNRVNIEFLNNKGANIPKNVERDIENTLCTEGINRCSVEDIKDVIEVDNLSYFYGEECKKLLQDINQIKKNSPKIFLTSSSQQELELATALLKSIGCKVDVEITSKPSLDRIRARVWEGKYSFGALMQGNGESLSLVDGKGRVVEKENYFFLVSLLLLKKGEDINLIAPHTFPTVFENLGKTYNRQVVRTKSNPASVMNEMLKEDKITGNYLQFILNYNAIWGLGIIVDYLVNNTITLSQLISELPVYFYKKQEIPCDWEDKGRIIKELIMENKEEDLELFEGVRIKDERGWGLILPDHELPVFNIYTQGHNEEYAQELCDLFTEKVKSKLKNQR
ncbi:nucleotidyl transferase [Alkalicella caledoniensis]|uniref:Nucleotidyl transferase n=2 Tax=Alkalicella caledoniensis TaxID=2731377 RepID=A0A7G9W5G0_ALKCA|nr:nucleotidyl transferase [Alkalicella caledoniensis]